MIADTTVATESFQRPGAPIDQWKRGGSLNFVLAFNP